MAKKNGNTVKFDIIEPKLDPNFEEHNSAQSDDKMKIWLKVGTAVAPYGHNPDGTPFAPYGLKANDLPADRRGRLPGQTFERRPNKQRKAARTAAAHAVDMTPHQRWLATVQDAVDVEIRLEKARRAALIQFKEQLPTVSEDDLLKSLEQQEKAFFEQRRAEMVDAANENNADKQ